MDTYRNHSRLDTLISWLSWAKLSRFGNTPLAKSFLYAPIVAQVVRYSSDFIEEHVGLGNISTLYWSLIYLAVGQFIFAIFCPREIKKYQDDIEKYKVENVSTLTDMQLEAKFTSALRANFKSGGGKAEIPKFDREAFIADMRDAHDIIDNDIYPYQKAYLGTTIDQHFVVYQGMAARVQGKTPVVTEMNWQLALVLNMMNPFGRHPDPEIAKEVQLGIHNLILERLDDLWKFASLERSYSELNLSHPIARAYAALFYACGSIYFIYYAMLNLFRMVLYTLNLS